MGFSFKSRSAWRALTLTAVVLAAVAMLSARPASAQANDTDLLWGVSCPSASACIAVGNYNNSAGAETALSEEWNGTTWTVQSTPTPSGATASQLSGVSCASASACTAVGWYETGSGPLVTLAEAWDGATWTVQSTPAPSGATRSQLSGVSCSSASACTAVGLYVPSGTFNWAPLAEAWNGTAWTVQSTPDPSGTTNSSELSKVSCTSASACTAVGWYEKSTTELALAEHWNGTAWTVQSAPGPGGTTNSTLDDVSCTSASSCTATGSYQPSGSVDWAPLAEAWNGATWTEQSTPNPSGSVLSSLLGVSCTSASACTAVGYWETSTSGFMTVAERWNGTSWTIQSTPTPSGAASTALNAVSCPSTSACTSVGYYQVTPQAYGFFSPTLTLADVWDGATWTIQTTPNQ